MPTNFQELVNIFLNLIYLTIPVVVGIALLVFFWGLVKFMVNVSGDSKAVTEGKNFMLWGTVALFIMISIWGIIRFLSNDIGFGPVALPLLPY